MRCTKRGLPILTAFNLTPTLDRQIPGRPLIRICRRLNLATNIPWGEYLILCVERQVSALNMFRLLDIPDTKSTQY